MVLKTPWVKEKTNAGTAFAVAPPIAALIADSSRCVDTVVGVPASQPDKSTADETPTPRLCSRCRSASAASVPLPRATFLRTRRAYVPGVNFSVNCPSLPLEL
jgi:hypothetical protein